RSPGSASATNTRRPSKSATPIPSCVKSTIVATPGPSAAMPRRSPEREVLREVGLARLLELRLDDLDLAFVARGIEVATRELPAQIDEIGVERVGLAIVADRGELAALIARPDLSAADTE